MVAIYFKFKYENKKYRAKVKYNRHFQHFDEFKIGETITQWKIYDQGNCISTAKTVLDRCDEISLICDEQSILFDKACEKLEKISQHIWERCNWNGWCSSAEWTQCVNNERFGDGDSLSEIRDVTGPSEPIAIDQYKVVFNAIEPKDLHFKIEH